MKKPISPDLIVGHTFGELTGIRFLRIEKTGSIFLFRCSCGVEKEAVAWRVRNGYAKSCGHLKYRSVEHHTWNRRVRELCQSVGLECKTNKQAAHALGISEGTVKEYLHRLYPQLAVGSRTEFVAHMHRARSAVESCARLISDLHGMGLEISK